MSEFASPEFGEAPYAGEGFASGLSWPKISIEADFTNDPGSAAEDWVQIGEVPTFSCRRGRQYELDRSETGTAGIMLDNSGAAFDPTNPTSPYNSGGRSLKVARRARIRATWAGVTYNLWRGFIERYPQSYSSAGFQSWTDMTCVDAFDPLGRVDLDAAYVHEVLFDNPLAYYPLGEPEGSTQAGDRSGNQQAPAVLLGQQGTATFGAEGGLADGSYSALELVKGDTAGFYLRMPDAATPTLSGGCAAEFIVASSNTASINATVSFQRATVGLTYTAILASSFTDEVSVSAANPFSDPTSLTSTAVVNDGDPHHVAIVLESDARTLKLYVDGQLDSQTTATAALSNGGYPVVATIGALQAAGGPSTEMTGRIGHVAVYDAPLTAARVLAHYQAFTGNVGDTSGERIDRILDYLGWPADQRSIAGGVSTLGMANLFGRKAGEALQEIATWENGSLTVDGLGRPVFADRSTRWGTSSDATYGEDDLPYEDGLRFDYDPTFVFNDITLTRTSGITVRVVDADSIASYFPRTHTAELGLETDAETLDRANYLLSRYAEPALRVEAVTLKPSTNEALWPEALGREIGDRVTVTRQAPGHTISGEFFVEHIEHQVTPEEWTTTFRLSPAVNEAFWFLGDATYGVLDDTTILAY